MIFKMEEMSIPSVQPMPIIRSTNGAKTAQTLWMSYDQLMMEFPLVKQHPCNFLNLIGTIQQSHVLLENEKNNYGKVSRN